MAKLITQAEYARSRKARGLPGGTKPAVLKAVRDGRITLVDGKVDPEQADREWLERTNRKQQRPAAAKDSKPALIAPDPKRRREDAESDERETLADAQARKETALANLRELEEAERRKELMPVSEAEANWAEIGSRVRDELSALPTRIVNRLPDEWRREVSRVVKEETNRALATLSDEFRADQQAA